MPYTLHCDSVWVEPSARPDVHCRFSWILFEIFSWKIHTQSIGCVEEWRSSQNRLSHTIVSYIFLCTVSTCDSCGTNNNFYLFIFLCIVGWLADSVVIFDFLLQFPWWTVRCVFVCVIIVFFFLSVRPCSSFNSHFDSHFWWKKPRTIVSSNKYS